MSEVTLAEMEAAVNDIYSTVGEIVEDMVKSKYPHIFKDKILGEILPCCDPEMAGFELVIDLYTDMVLDHYGVDQSNIERIMYIERFGRQLDDGGEVQ